MLTGLLHWSHGAGSVVRAGFAVPGMKREHGARPAGAGFNAKAARATVSGDCPFMIHWLWPGRGTVGTTREPGDLPKPMDPDTAADGAAWRLTMTTATSTRTLNGSQTGLRTLALVVFMAGAGLVFVTGFAGSTMLHNAAHDSRHAMSFPCH